MPYQPGRGKRLGWLRLETPAIGNGELSDLTRRLRCGDQPQAGRQ